MFTFPISHYGGVTEPVDAIQGEHLHATRLSRRTTFDFTNVPFVVTSADRLIVVFITGHRSATRSISSATIGGISATIVLDYAPQVSQTSIISAVVPTGTSGTVHIVYSSDQGYVHISVYSVKDYQSTTPEFTDQIINTSIAPTSTISPIADTLVIAHANSFNVPNTGTIAWSGSAGLVEDTDLVFDDTIHSSAMKFFDSAETNVTITATPTHGTTNRRMQVIAWSILIGAWDVGSAVYANKSLTLSGQGNGIRGVFMKEDGTSFYSMSEGSDKIFQYTLTTAFDLSSGNYANKSFSTFGQTSTPISLFINPDGTEFYIATGAGAKIEQYTMSIPWDISSGSTTGNFSTSGQDGNPKGITFKPDGLTMYIAGSATDKIFQYTLTIAWDVTTASYANKFFLLTGQTSDPQGMYINPDGDKMFVISNSGTDVFQYTLGTPHDVSTAAYDTIFFDVGSQITTFTGNCFSSNGNTMYGAEHSGTAYQYNLDP